MPRTLAALTRPLLLGLAATLLIACPTAADDDDSTPLIEPPEGCSNFSLSGVTFDFFLRFGGVDYPMDGLEDLMVLNGWQQIGLPIEGKVVRVDTDPGDDDKRIVRVETLPPDEPEDDWEPDWLEITAELPPGYDLPAVLDEEMVAFFQMDLSSGSLISGFALLDSPDDGGALRFLAEPSTLGFAFPANNNHPFFTSIDAVDRGCPNLTEFQCAKLFNLAVRFTPQPVTPEGPANDPFELWPTDTAEFTIGESVYEVVNVFSYTHREISDACTGFDWAADRMSYFVTRVGTAPAR